MAHDSHPTDIVGTLKTDCPDCREMVKLMNPAPPRYVVVYVDAGTSYLARWLSGSGIYETQARGNSADLKRLAQELNSNG